MIHEWFMHFGGLAMLFTVLAFFATRTYVKRNPPRHSEDEQARAWGFLVLGFLSVAVLVVSFFLVCFGVTATIPGWIGFALLGAAFGMLTGR